MKIRFQHGKLTGAEQAAVSAGFEEHADELGAPTYTKEHVKWVGTDDSGNVVAVLTADILWDWLYIDELWVSSSLRGAGTGRELMKLADAFAQSHELFGIWLWTQSWQAEQFYTRLGYETFARFDNFPRGHARVGLRKPVTR